MFIHCSPGNIVVREVKSLRHIVQLGTYVYLIRKENRTRSSYLLSETGFL